MPGPTPTLCPVFPEDFIQQAHLTVRRKTASHQAVQRYQLGLLLHQEPHLSHEEAGHRVGLSGSQVRRWRRRWTAGDFSVLDTSGRGRKPTFSPAGPRTDQGSSL
jgi:Winged helix-turn helix